MAFLAYLSAFSYLVFASNIASCLIESAILSASAMAILANLSEFSYFALAFNSALCLIALASNSAFSLSACASSCNTYLIFSASSSSFFNYINFCYSNRFSKQRRVASLSSI